LVDTTSEAVFGERINADELSNEMAAGVVRLLFNDAYTCARFVDAYRTASGAEAVKFEVDVERPQRPVAPIARRELIAAIFTRDVQPIVFALRPGFPRESVHLNLGAEGDSPWLCLDDRPWDEIRPRWTALTFVERIRWWLAATARGDLHGEAQPVEPVFGAGVGLIIPPGVAKSDSDGNILYVHGVFNEAEPTTIVMREGARGGEPSGAGFLPVFFKAEPQIMRRMRWAPENIKELHNLLQDWGIDLISGLREQLKKIRLTQPSQLVSRALILTQIPILNPDGTATGQADIKAFATRNDSNLAKLGMDLGIFLAASELANSNLVVPRIPAEVSMRGEHTEVLVLSVHLNFDRAAASVASGLSSDARAVTLIGAGAIGSHLIELMRRDGFGTWTVVDNDAFLPHNVQRHRAPEAVVGAPKAKITAAMVDSAVGASNETKAICANVLAADSDCEASLKAAALIIDASASVPVARFLSDRSDISAPRLSVFFNTVGSDVVLLAESARRSVMLDALEAQYYRAILEMPSLSNHISASGNSYQYAVACRSVSFQMPEHRVSMLTGAIAGEIRRHLAFDDATISIWSAHDESGLSRHSVPVLPVERRTRGGWQIIIDQGIIQLAKELREKALPSETGGILLGTIDIPRQQICIVRLVPAPSDSFGSRQGFERGTKNLAAIVADASRRTAGQVEYVGEWHSHPKGARPLPSDTDIDQLCWLGIERTIEELPALMMIVGDGDDYTLNIVVPLASYRPSERIA
jgi:integrative and conjugative element protein (TIGR02256 family)